MYKKLTLPILALIGVVFAIFMVVIGAQKPKAPPIPYLPPSPPFTYFVSGAGIVEANTENVSIGTPFNELIKEVFVKSGDKVKGGTPLFSLNTTTVEAEKARAESELHQAVQKLNEAKRELSFYEKVRDRRAVSEQQFSKAEYEVAIREKGVEIAKNSVALASSYIDRSVVTAPADGTILELNVRVGQSADQNPFDSKPLILFGNIEPFHIRVDIDENDAWRVFENCSARAFVRGNSSMSIPLKFIRIEPFIRPKRSLTGDDLERIDTRVLQVVFEMKKNNYPIYPGQILDIYLEAFPSEARTR